MKSMYVKRIGTIATGAVMLGAALSGAVGAGIEDLNTDFFYNEDMSPKVTLVVGAKAAASDGIAAGNLAATIGNLAYATETITVESDPVVCTTQAGGEGGACVGEGSVVLTTTAATYKGVMDQDQRSNLIAADDNFYSDDGVYFDGGGEQIYSEEEGNFKEIKTTEVCEARTDEVKIEVLLDKDYVNNQCFLCYNICQDTVTDLEHEMAEMIGIDKDGVTYYEEGVDSDELPEALKMAVKGDSIQYAVYTDYLPPTFLKNDDGDLIDSRYRGKLIFLGDEYLVKEWDDGDGILKLAKGVERKLDNKAFGGDFEAGEGTYQFKIHRAIFSEDQVAGVVIDVKKPDGTEVQVIAQRSLNAVVSDVEIYSSNVATAGDFVTADVKLYDLNTEITLEDKEDLEGYEEWYVELEAVDLGCVTYMSDDEKSDCYDANDLTDWKTISNNAGVDEYPEDPDKIGVGDTDAQDRFTDYDMVDPNQAGAGMLQYIRLTLRADYDDEDALGVGDSIDFPYETFQFSYEGYKTDNLISPRCSGGDEDRIEIKKAGKHEVTISFTNDNGDRYDDVRLDQGPYVEGDLFMVDGEVYEFVEERGVSGEEAVEIKVKNLFDSTDVKTTDNDQEFDASLIDEFQVEFTTFDDEAESDSSSRHFTATLEFPEQDIDATYDGSYLYLAQMPDANTPATVGIDPDIVGEITQFDIDDNKLNIFIEDEDDGGADLNDDDQDDDILIGLFTEAAVECMCVEEAEACSANCEKVFTGEIAYIDFYDSDGPEECGDRPGCKVDDWENSVLVVGSDGGILDDEDDADTLWLPNGGDEITADYGSDDEIEGVTICHPKTKVYQTYFIGKGKEDEPSSITITEADVGKKRDDIGYTIEAFNIGAVGTAGTNVTTATEVTNVTATAECDTDTIMPVGNLVVSDAQSPSGNLIVIGGSGANNKCTATLCDGQGDKIKIEGDKLYIVGYTASETQQAASQVNNWLQANIH